MLETQFSLLHNNYVVNPEVEYEIWLTGLFGKKFGGSKHFNKPSVSRSQGALFPGNATSVLPLDHLDCVENCIEELTAICRPATNPAVSLI